MTMLFVAAFEFGPGPIVWLYMGEILNDKSMNVGAFVNWTFVLIISLFTPTMMNPEHLNSYGTFMVFGGCNIVGTIFILLFMKETKDLSDLQVKLLYRKGGLTESERNTGLYNSVAAQDS